eukprot:GGOE01063692.1.p3 GENE.GGOE01063692.1~~GGOE01063692.1.p3  ORF type:complete len:108 (+),score=4.85 GGOE01063692.1:92-415(+)
MCSRCNLSAKICSHPPKNMAALLWPSLTASLQPDSFSVPSYARHPASPPPLFFFWCSMFLPGTMPPCFWQVLSSANQSLLNLDYSREGSGQGRPIRLPPAPDLAPQS